MDVKVINTSASNIAHVEVWNGDVLIATLEVREAFDTTIKTTANIMSPGQSHTFTCKS